MPSPTLVSQSVTASFSTSRRRVPNRERGGLAILILALAIVAFLFFVNALNNRWARKLQAEIDALEKGLAMQAPFALQEIPLQNLGFTRYKHETVALMVADQRRQE